MGRDLYQHRPTRTADDERVSRRALFGLGLTPVARRDVGYDAVTDQVRAAWGRSEHEPLLRAIEPVGEVLAGLSGVGRESRVLDVGAGDGNVARAASRRGADVVACDLTPAMVARGRDRCPEADWRVADAAALPYPDASFDALISSFAVPLAADPTRIVTELARVIRPGGTIALTAWVPRGLPGGLDELVEAHRPLPTGVPSPSDWGRQGILQQRLAGSFEALDLRTRTVQLRFADAAAAYDALVGPYGLAEDDHERLRPAFGRLLGSFNDAVDGVEIAARYLLAIGHRAVTDGD